ncbi:MAG: hypothetical protein IH865_07870 [Chloroflexi bacterium]|nr:hypothetical protein [Chloroflexota bacterium]
MAIRGFFSKTHLTPNPDTPTSVPYVHAEILIPSTGKSVIASFLIDTGADMTVIHPQDGLRLFSAAQITAIPGPIDVGGAGHGKLYYPIDAEVSFLHDHGEVQTVSITAYVAEATNNVTTESLLGRDVLGSFIMNFDQAGETVTFGG